MQETPKKIHLAFIGPERRRYRRLTEALPVKFKIITKDKLAPSCDGITENISEGGIFLEMPVSVQNSVPVGTKLDIEIDIPNVPEPVKASGEVLYVSEVVKAQGEVRWVREEKPDQAYKFGTGVKFIEISNEGKDKIANYIRIVDYVRRRIF